MSDERDKDEISSEGHRRSSDDNIMASIPGIAAITVKPSRRFRRTAAGIALTALVSGGSVGGVMSVRAERAAAPTGSAAAPGGGGDGGTRPPGSRQLDRIETQLGEIVQRVTAIEIKVSRRDGIEEERERSSNRRRRRGGSEE